MHPQVVLPLPHVINLNLQIPLQLRHLMPPSIDATVFEHLVLLVNFLLKLLARELLTLLG